MGNPQRIHLVMTEEAKESVLERLAARGSEAMPKAITPARALKHGVVRALELAVDMEAAVTELLEDQLDL